MYENKVLKDNIRRGMHVQLLDEGRIKHGTIYEVLRTYPEGTLESLVIDLDIIFKDKTRKVFPLKDVEIYYPR